MTEIANREDIVGASITVGLGDSIVFSAGYGLADRERGVSTQPYHRFRIYSLSKHLAATAAAKLAQIGALELDAPIEKYMPLIHPNLHGITARQLIGHLSGIRHYANDDWQLFANASCTSPFEALLWFQGDSLEFKPGDEFGYTTYGYVVLSALIEKVSGKPFLDCLQDLLFSPAGINNVKLDDADQIDYLAARPYEYWQGVMYNARYANNVCKYGGGGLAMSTLDLVSFDLALLNNRIVNQKTKEKLFESMTLNDGEPTDYGFGIERATDNDSRLYLWHSGRSRGGRNALVIYPEERLVVAISANTNGESIVKEAETIAKTFLNATE